MKKNSSDSPQMQTSSAAQTWEAERERGKKLRANVPREAHGEFSPAAGRPDPVRIITDSNLGRQERFIPLRMQRMAESSFAFLRGAAGVMAHDLSRTPVTGITVHMNGDAHLENFGLYGTVDGEVVFDLNDFDEALPGYWEWDLKRLAVSINVAARANGFGGRLRRASVMQCVKAYRTNLQQLETMGVLEIWYLHSHPGEENPLSQMDLESKAVFTRAVKAAGLQTNGSLLERVTTLDRNGTRRFAFDPPVLTAVDAETRQQIIDGLAGYAESLRPEMRYLIGRYRVVDVAHRVVGTGSVGTRAYLVLLLGNGDHDPLFLQVKEAWPSASAPYVPPVPAEYAHEGKRVIVGQRALQARSDILLGWTDIAGRPFYVRQMKNMKGSIPPVGIGETPFLFYAATCGAVLARAHARTGSAAAIAGYCGKSEELDAAIARFAEAYASQNESDSAAFVETCGPNFSLLEP
ncbi:MAG: DUF2252 domain-containing protein [Bryobacteraceae bacterium]